MRVGRRTFLERSAALGASAGLANVAWGQPGPGYASPREAVRGPRESLLFVTALCPGSDRPDYLAVVDVDPKSKSFSSVIARLPMPTPGDELHHFGWNACSSCHDDAGKTRQYLILPGNRSGRIHIVDVLDPRKPVLRQVIDGDEIARRTDLTAPHTVHCLADGKIMISMLGNREGKGPGGFLLLNPDFSIAGRWERSTAGMRFNYDFWYQPRLNVMVSSEWGSPTTYQKGFDLADVMLGRYGQSLHFWDWKERTIAQSIDLGAQGSIPLEVRFLHDPDSDHGYAGAALASNVWHWYRDSKRVWQAENVISVTPVPDVPGWKFPTPALITDILVSMDDRYLYFSNWLHGDVRQYDISDRGKPKLVGQVWCGGLLGKGPTVKGKKLAGGPQMLQLSLDGKRLYVTSSLYSSWDDQFYPAIGKEGSTLIQIDCDTKKGGLEIRPDFLVDFGSEPGGPSRAHEMRYPGGDCTSEIWG